MIGAAVIWFCGFIGTTLVVTGALGGPRVDRMEPEFTFGVGLVWVAITVAVRLGRETP